MERSKQSKPSKHEGELQLECIQQNIWTPISPSNKLWGMFENKKLELKRIFYKNVALCETDNVL